MLEDLKQLGILPLKLLTLLVELVKALHLCLFVSIHAAIGV
jgi:hypothetical protein